MSLTLVWLAASANTFRELQAIENPYDPRTKDFEAYVQNRKPGAYCIFWCYGPKKNEITIIANMPHP